MEPVVPELLQEEANPQRIVEESLDLLSNPERQNKTITGYGKLRQKLGKRGACDRAAKEILEFSKGE